MKEKTGPASPAGFLRRGGWIAIVDFVAFCALLAGFAYVHHGMVRTETGAHLVSCRSGVTLMLEDGFERAFDGGEAGVFSFDGMFLYSAPESATYGDTTYYKDGGCELIITDYYIATGRVQVAEVYVSDITRLQTAMANDSYGKGQREDPLALTRRSGAVFSITGDNYSERSGGVVMRNGVLYSSDIDRDICVLNWDGTMELCRQADFNLAAIMDNGAYQIWSFGPILMENGEPAGEYITDMTMPCRRAAIGYYEPGHYCFVIMDGEVTLEELANTMDVLGCESAYALYGGRLAEMNYMGETISTPQEVDRKCSDIIMITE